MRTILLAGVALVLIVLAAPDQLHAQTPAAQAPSTPSGATSAALPETIPLFPLPDTVLFPNMSVPLHVFEPRYKTMLQEALKGDRIIGTVQLRPGYEPEYENTPPIFPIGCAGVIAVVHEKPDGEYDIVLRGVAKFRVTQEVMTRPYRVARVTTLAEIQRPEDKAALHERRERLDGLMATAAQRLGFSPVPDGIADEMLVDAIAQYLEMDNLDRQALLEQDGLVSRADALIAMIEAMLKGAPPP